MAGLQGSGKTTNAAKLARWFKQQGRNPILVGADLQRPAAVEQLRTLGRQIDVPVFSQPGDPVETAKAGLEEARRLGRDVLIVDTAGRLAIDEELMEQVRHISDVTSPDYTFLVIDAMTGQDAVTTAESFNATLALDGVILTKLDGDARGGAALSVKEVVGKPIAFASTGEKLADFELFHPDRLAGRILGMGDMLTLIEKAEQVYEQDEAEAAAARLLEGTFTLDDFLDQMQQLKKMGPLSGVVGMIPGMPKELKGAQIEDEQLARVEAIIRSMTPGERADVDLIDGSRRARIARVGVGPRRGQPARQAVQGDAEADEAHARDVGHEEEGAGREGQEGQEGRPGDGAAVGDRAQAEGALHPAGLELTHLDGPPWSAASGRSRGRRKEDPSGREAPPDADGQEEAADLPRGGGRPRSPRNGRFIEILGTYDPRQEPSVVKIDTAKANIWISKGAQPTETVARLLAVAEAQPAEEPTEAAEA